MLEGVIHTYQSIPMSVTFNKDGYIQPATFSTLEGNQISLASNHLLSLLPSTSIPITTLPTCSIGIWNVFHVDGPSPAK